MSAQTTEVAQLYVAMFGKAPDADGLAFWADMLNSGQTTTSVADQMFATAPARFYFPSDLSKDQIIASFYTNVLGRQADAEGLAYWTAKLDAAGATPGSVIADIVGVVASYAGTDPAGVRSAALFNDRAAAAEYYGVHGGSIEHSTSVLAGVTEIAATAVASRNFTISDPVALASYDVGGFTEVTLGTVMGGITLTNMADGTNVQLSGQPSNISVSLQLRDSSAWANELTVTLGSARSDTVHIGDLSTPGVENLNLVVPSFAEVTLDAANGPSNVDISGSNFLTLNSNGWIQNLDASGLSQSLDFSELHYPGPFEVVGTGADDRLFASCVRVDGGDGHDTIYVPAGCIATGGSGSDTFVWRCVPLRDIPTITDFTKTQGGTTGDKLSLVGVGPNAVFNSAAVNVTTATSLRDCADAACADNVALLGHTVLHWFQYQGDTYVVADNSGQSTFQDVYDACIKLEGLIDLGSGVSIVGSDLQA